MLFLGFYLRCRYKMYWYTWIAFVFIGKYEWNYDWKIKLKTIAIHNLQYIDMSVHIGIWPPTRCWYIMFYV